MTGRILKIAPVLLVALLLAIAVACSGGGDDGANGSNADGADSNGPAIENSDSDDSGEGDGDSVSTDGDGPSEPLVANVSEALGRSVETFEQDVSSVRAEFSMDVNAADMSMTMDGEMAFRSEDEFYMRVEIAGEGGEFDSEFVELGELGRFEVLALGNDVWAYIPFFGGWFYMDAEEMEASEDFSFGDFLEEDGSPFDYSKIVEALGGSVEDLGLEEVDGGTFHHFQVTLTADDVASAFAEAFGDGETTGLEDLPADALTEPMVVDLWLYPETYLPHKIEASASFSAEGESGNMTFSVRFLDYNGDVILPDPPEDAQRFEEMFGGLFEDFEFELETPAP